jgi:glutamyl/glutaminyl-tRNA synthetase
MKVYNTRFNPTPDGGLHFGNLYMALVNEAEAHRTGGKFNLRFDDTQVIWQLRQTEINKRMVMAQQIDQMTWFGIKPDLVNTNTDMAFEASHWLHVLCPNGIGVKSRTRDHGYEWIGNTMEPYPYLPDGTAEKVIMDCMQDVNLLIRGDDLLSEASLYKYFCDLFGWEAPRQVYLPRLGTEGESMSKTNGLGSVESYRKDGGSAGNLRRRMAEWCLKDPKGEWFIENIKDKPWLG